MRFGIVELKSLIMGFQYLLTATTTSIQRAGFLLLKSISTRSCFGAPIFFRNEKKSPLLPTYSLKEVKKKAKLNRFLLKFHVRFANRIHKL